MAALPATRALIVARVARVSAAAYAADDAWQASLTAAFGKRALDRRYEWDQSAHPAECQRLGNAKLAADREMGAAYASLRACDVPELAA